MGRADQDDMDCSMSQIIKATLNAEVRTIECHAERHEVIGRVEP